MSSSDNDWLENSSETADGAYSPDKFYTASRNKKGFTSTVRQSVPPEVLAHIGELVASRTVPEYRTSADFFRDAIVHRLHYVTGLMEAGTPLSAESLRLQRMLIVEAKLDRLNALVEENKRIAERAHNILRNIDSGNRPEAIAVLRDLLPDITDPNLRDQLMHELSR